jgi:2-oxoglutarate ferredoxin oxidoreductase subunit gamma
MSQYEVTFAGFGGQGIMTAGQLLAYAGISEGKQVVWIPSYGPEMRGGTAYCTVVISDRRIGSPIINNPLCACVFNRPSLDKFAPRVKANGVLIVNSSLIDVKSDRTDIRQILVPADDIALEKGNRKAANIVVLGAFIAVSKIVNYDTVLATIKDKLSKKKAVLDTNLKAVEEGYQLALKSSTGRKKA